MLKINDTLIDHRETEFGVELDNGLVYICDGEEDAQFTAAWTGGKLRVREVYMTAWAEVKGE